MQRMMPLPAEISGDIRTVDPSLVAKCNTEQEAMRLCRRLSKTHYSDESLADLLGVSKGHLNQLLNADLNKRRRHTSRDLGNKLQRICGNRALNQWADMELDGLLEKQRSKTDRLRELEAELALLKAGTT